MATMVSVNGVGEFDMTQYFKYKSVHWGMKEGNATYWYPDINSFAYTVHNYIFQYSFDL